MRFQVQRSSFPSSKKPCDDPNIYEYRLPSETIWCIDIDTLDDLRDFVVRNKIDYYRKPIAIDWDGEVYDPNTGEFIPIIILNDDIREKTEFQTTSYDSIQKELRKLEQFTLDDKVVKEHLYGRPFRSGG